VASRKGQTLTAVLLVAGAACISGYLAFSGGATSQAVVPAPDPKEAVTPRNAVHRTTDPASKQGFQRPMIKAEIPTKPIMSPGLSSAAILNSRSLPAEGVKEKRDVPENVLPIRTPAPQALTVAYSIQLGSFRNPNHAERHVHLYKSLGLKAFSRRVDLPNKGVFHRVLVGAFGTRDEARAHQGRLREKHHLKESLIISSAKH
jgi:cell division septation protein DedD